MAKTKSHMQSGKKGGNRDPAMFRVWTDPGGVIQRVDGSPDGAPSRFAENTLLTDNFSDSDRETLRSLIRKIRKLKYLEMDTVTVDGNPFHIVATPETNSKRLNEIAFMFIPVAGTERSKHLEFAHYDQIVRGLQTNPNLWLDVFLLENTRIIAWNAGAERISGYSGQELIETGVAWGWLYPDTDYRTTNWRLMMDSLEGQGINEMVSRIRCRDGSEKIIGWTSQYLHTDDGRPFAVMNIGFDLTRETQYRHALASSEEEYRTLADNSPDLIARFDQLYRCTYTNASTTPFNLFGITRELIGKAPSSGLSDPKLAANLENRIRQVFMSRQVQSFEVVTGPQEGNRVFEVHLVPELSPEEIIRSVLLISRDISLRRWSEHRLRTAERFEAAGRVACEMTHNINNRLTVLNGKLE
ncbi:MAG TPA: PAS domain S-box protein, partial [bacterium]|nr:PAS domain S-box protein [bacterium]